MEDKEQFYGINFDYGKKDAYYPIDDSLTRTLYMWLIDKGINVVKAEMPCVIYNYKTIYMKSCFKVSNVQSIEYLFNHFLMEFGISPIILYSCDLKHRFDSEDGIELIFKVRYEKQ